MYRPCGARLRLGVPSVLDGVRLKETGKDYALKIMLKSFIMREKKDRAIVTERNTKDRLDNPGIVKLCFTFQDEDNLYMATELCRAGELFDQIHQKTKLDLESARFYAAEVVLMLEYLASEVLELSGNAARDESAGMDDGEESESDEGPP